MIIKQSRRCLFPTDNEFLCAHLISRLLTDVGLFLNPIQFSHTNNDDEHQTPNSINQKVMSYVCRAQCSKRFSENLFIVTAHVIWNDSQNLKKHNTCCCSIGWRDDFDRLWELNCVAKCEAKRLICD